MRKLTVLKNGHVLLTQWTREANLENAIRILTERFHGAAIDVD